MNEVITEWWTGRDVKGSPSRLVRWTEGPFGPQFARHVEDLAAHLARAVEATHVRVRLARGADGATDLRIETEGPRGVEVTRWRPEDGNLDTDVLEGARTLEKVRSPRTVKDRDWIVEKADVGSLDATTVGISALKSLRFELLERAEAGADVAADIAAVDAKLAVVRVEHDALHVARKLALAAETAEREAWEAERAGVIGTEVRAADEVNG